MLSLTLLSTLLASDTATKSADALKLSERDLPGISIFSDRKRRRTAGSAHKLSEKTLQRQSHDDIHRILGQVPGVYTREEEGYGLRPNIGLRGASSDRSAKVTLMEDGILIAPAPYSAPAAYYFPISSRLVGLEVYKGAAAIQFGPQTIGGAINLLSRQVPERRPEVLLRSANGNFGYGKAHFAAGGMAGRIGGLIDVVHVRADGYHRIDGSAGPDTGGNSGFSKNEVVLKSLWRNSSTKHASHRALLKLGYADEVSNASYLGLTRPDFERDPYRRYLASKDDRMAWARWQGVLEHSFSWAHGHMRSALYQNRFHRSWRKVAGLRGGPSIGDLIRSNTTAGVNGIWLALIKGEEDSVDDSMAILLGTNTRSYLSSGVQSTIEHKVGPHRLNFGLRLHHDTIDRHHTAEGVLVQSGELVSDGRPEQDTTLNHAWTRALSLHALDEWQLRPNLFLSAGSRFEAIEGALTDHLGKVRGENQQLIALPGLGLFYQRSRALGLLIGVHRGFSPVAPGQSKEIDPEESVNLEAGLRFRVPQREFELIGFANLYSNMLGQCTQSKGCPNDLLDAQFNGGAVDVYGAEVSGKVSGIVSRLRWELKGAYTLTASSFRTSFSSASSLFGDVEAGDALPYVPTHQAKIGMRLRVKPVTLDIAGVYYGVMRDTAGQGEVDPASGIPAHQLLDATLRWALSKRVSLRVGGRNLLDTPYLSSARPYGARAGSPRQLLIGFDLGKQ